MLRYLTAGESHGECLVAILEGLPAGLCIDAEAINAQLKRRQSGYGRGKRMQEIETDVVKILSGTRGGNSIGSPLTLVVANKDHSIDTLPEVTRPRPGHADLAGGTKYNRKDMRDILERASARETAVRVALGAVCAQLLEQFGITIFSHIVAIGGIEAHMQDLTYDAIRDRARQSVLHCADEAAEKCMIEEIDKMRAQGDTLGGVFEVCIGGLPVGLGSHVHHDRRLDAALAQAIISIQAVKAVEIGDGMDNAARSGAQVHDAITYEPATGFSRAANRAGGIEGGMSTGEPVIIRGYMKPIATLMQPLGSVDIITKKDSPASVERSDTCAVPAAGVVAEAVCAFEVAKSFLEKFGGDSLDEIRRNYDGYIKQVEAF